MGRRTATGGFLEEHKTTLLILLGIAESAAMLCCRQLLETVWLKWGLMAAVILLCCAGAQLMTGTVSELFSLLLIPTFFFGGLGILSVTVYRGGISNGAELFWMAILAWGIPVLYAVAAAWIRGAAANSGFYSFFVAETGLFYLVYFALIIYGVFFYAKSETGQMVQLIPFATLAAYIDAIIQGTVDGQALVSYLLYQGAFFIPFGFFVALIGQRIPVLLRLLLLVLLPAFIELAQLILHLNRCDVDDFLFAFIGGLVGMLLFFLFNELFLLFTTRNYDGSEPDRDYLGRRM